MSSIHHSTCSDDLEFDSCQDMSFSWCGITLFVDLQIDPENVDSAGQTSVADHSTVLHDKDPDDGANKEPGSTRESCSLQHDTDAIKDHHLVSDKNDEKDCNTQPPSEVEDQCRPADVADTNWTHCTWPDWGEPLPPEDLSDDDDIAIDSAADGEKNPNLKNAVTFTDADTIVEPGSLQEERETGSFSFASSSDEELEQGTDKVTSRSDGNSNDLLAFRVPCSREKESLNSADVSAACHLLELGNESNCQHPNVVGFESSQVSTIRKPEFYDPSRDLERLSELIEFVYADSPHLSNFSNSQGRISSEGVGSWTIEVSKDSGRLRMKRIKRQKEAEFEGVGVLEVDDDNEVLERPPWKRQYKSISKF